MNRIRELRKEKNLTQTDLAKLLNTTTSNVSGWECGKWQPDNDTLIKLAEIFNVSVDYLLEREVISSEEQAAGASATKKISITPIEDEMLYAFREVGKRHGEKVQRTRIDLAEVLAEK